MKRLAPLVLTACGLLNAQPPKPPAGPPQPVYILLYTRFYDHSQPHTTDERLQRLMPILDKLNKQYPQAGVSALLQFSGTVSQEMDERNGGLHLADQVKDHSRRGLVDIGYTGEDEPSYLYRPKPALLEADTPEARWAAKAEAAERFLTDFKNPVTGLPAPGLSGGLKRTLEVFGDVRFATGLTTSLGGDAPSTHELHKMVPGAILGGIPGNDRRRGIEGYDISAANFSNFMSPDSFEAPEVFWEDGHLRLSDASLADNKPHATDEGPEALKKVFQALDRSRARVIKLEVVAYKRYLTRRADGSVTADPLEWMYYHPDEPQIPIQMHAMVTQTEVEAGYKKDEAALQWLLGEFLPANPGSRLISVHELAQLAVPGPAEVDAAELKALATDLNGHFVRRPMEAPNFGRAGSHFFSLAESFELLAKALAGVNRTGGLPGSVALTPVYGPLTLPNDMGPNQGSVQVSEVIKAAAQVAPAFSDTEWKIVPANAVPTFIQVASLRVNATQFLRLMTQAYLDPAPDKNLSLSAMALGSQATFMFPKNTPITDQGNSWTFKPAPLHITAAAPAATPAAR